MFDEAIKAVGEATEKIHGINPYKKEVVENAFGIDEEAVDDKYENLNPADDIFAGQEKEED